MHFETVIYCSRFILSFALDLDVPIFPYAAFMSPLINACSLAIIERPKNIGWMSNCTIGKNKSCSIQLLVKEGSKCPGRFLCLLEKIRFSR